MVAIKGWTWSETMLRLAVAFKLYPIGTKGPKVCQEKHPPYHYTNTTSLHSGNNINKAFSPTGLLHTGCFSIFTPFFVNPRNGCV